MGERKGRGRITLKASLIQSISNNDLILKIEPFTMLKMAKKSII